jgi:hypothetical protein
VELKEQAALELAEAAEAEEALAEAAKESEQAPVA